MMYRLAGVLLLAILAWGCAAWAGSAQGSDFTTIRDVPLTGGTGRIDYQSLDPGAHRLYIARLEAGVVTVYDTAAGSVVGDVANVPGAHGVLAVPDLGRVYASATARHQVAVIDPGTLTVIDTVPAGDYPDGLAYVPALQKLYVSDEHGKADIVIDPLADQVVAAIRLGGEAGNTQYDAASGQILVAVHTGQLVAIDPTTDQIVGRAEVPGCREPHGLSIDADRRVAFVGCQGNAKLAVVDLTSMQVTATFDVGRSPDVLAYDPEQGRLFVAAESGPLTAFELGEAGVREIARGTVGPNAHTVAVDPATHHLYLPLANVEGQPLLREVALSSVGGG